MSEIIALRRQTAEQSGPFFQSTYPAMPYPSFSMLAPTILIVAAGFVPINTPQIEGKRGEKTSVPARFGG